MLKTDALFLGKDNESKLLSYCFVHTSRNFSSVSVIFDMLLQHYKVHTHLKINLCIDYNIQEVRTYKANDQLPRYSWGKLSLILINHIIQNTKAHMIHYALSLQLQLFLYFITKSIQLWTFILLFCVQNDNHGYNNMK